MGFTSIPPSQPTACRGPNTTFVIVAVIVVIGLVIVCDWVVIGCDWGVIVVFGKHNLPQGRLAQKQPTQTNTTITTPITTITGPITTITSIRDASQSQPITL